MIVVKKITKKKSAIKKLILYVHIPVGPLPEYRKYDLGHSLWIQESLVPCSLLQSLLCKHS